MAQNSNNLPICARGLVKRFGVIKAVSNIDLNLAPGEALGLLGPNGAGKTTSLSMLMGLLNPDAGKAMIFGQAAGSPAARALSGATPQLAAFPGQLSPREILEYTAARYGVTPKIDDLVAGFALEQLIDQRMDGFSGGEQRKVALALAFVGMPKLVFLDEPSAGLDIEAQDRFREYVGQFTTQGRALVLTSHHWDEIEALCDTIVLIDRGEAVLNGRIEEMRARAKMTRITFCLPDGLHPPKWIKAKLRGTCWGLETTDSDAVLRRMVKENVPFQSLTLQPLELKELIDRIRQEENLQ